MTTRSLDNTPTTIRVAVHDLFLIAPCNDDVMCQREPEALYAALISAICSTLHRCGSESQPTTLETCADLPLLCAGRRYNDLAHSAAVREAVRKPPDR